ncbi:MAG TPA: PAS domain-containing protein [Verrucomicrobiae bacterium]|jgi:PAS domain S-box-containing protein|nr:PAS domain-containing protein [Verrucomicrobiae bacterium]
MKLFRDLPIQSKMLVMTLLICGAILCVAILTLFSFQVLNFRSNFQRDTATLAVVIANNSTAAMEFKDDQAANEVVRALKAESTVVAATLTLPDGTTFAHVGAPENSKDWSDFPPAGKSRFVGGDLLVTQPVIWKQEQVGVLYLRSDYRHTFLALLELYGIVVLGVMIVSTWLAVFLSKRLGRNITSPVLQLAETARIVGERKDYSVRAAVGTRLDELGRLAESFNDMLGRIQSQDSALSLSRQKFEALVHAIDGIVWERNAETFQFTFISRQSETILGYAPATWLETPNFWESKLHPQDAAKAARMDRNAAERGQPYTHEYRMIAADGRVVWIRESGTALMDAGKALALRGIFQDITQQKADAEQLDKLNRQLIDASRSAGMADVATGVLHNVGNVLNSVGVSATSVADRLRRSKVTNLGRVTAMLREQNGRIAEYLTQDPKGKLLPEYLSTVAEEMAVEQQEMVAKMVTVGEHIEHIKEIVAMQQSYAKVSGVFENLSAAELVEDAVQLNTAAFERHHITIVRDYEEGAPHIWVDRHKFLQILINLLRNAKYAMEGKGENEKQIILRVALAPEGRVRVIVIDNGLGIPAENMPKIFLHGFTTRPTGHGFGLHSGANAAKEMGGSLTAHSDGPGRGAAFTLELPVTPKFRPPAQT